MSLLARRLADLLAAPFRCAPPFSSQMIEPLEGRRLLSTTVVDAATWDNGTTADNITYQWQTTTYLDGALVAGDVSSDTFTLSNLPPHTHVEVKLESGVGNPGGTNFGQETVSVSAGTAYSDSITKQENGLDGEYYDFPSKLLRHDGSTLQITFTTSGLDADDTWNPHVHVTVYTPEVSVSSSAGMGGDADASEGDPVDTGTFIFYRYGAPVDVPLTVNYHMSGTATPEDEIDPESGLPDYKGLTRDGHVYFEAGSVKGKVIVDGSQVTATLIPINDGIDEPAETATATLMGGGPYLLPGPVAANILMAKASLTVTPAVLTLTPPAAPAPPGGAPTGTATATLTGARGGRYSITRIDAATGTPPAAGNIITLVAPATLGTTATLTFTFNGTVPAGKTYEYLVDITDANSGARDRIRIKI